MQIEIYWLSVHMRTLRGVMQHDPVQFCELEKLVESVVFDECIFDFESVSSCLQRIRTTHWDVADFSEIEAALVMVEFQVNMVKKLLVAQYN